MQNFSSNGMMPGQGRHFIETRPDSHRASVQFSEKKVTDKNANRTNVENGDYWLKDNGYLREDQYTVGVSASINGDNISHKEPINAQFKVTSLDGYPSLHKMIMETGKSLEVITVEVQMSIVDFWALFDHLEISLFGGCEYLETETETDLTD